MSFNEQNDDFKFVFDALKQSNPKYSPNVLIADNAPSINNGFEKSFKNTFKRVNCWAHASRNIDKILRSVDKRYANEIREVITITVVKK